MCRTMYVLGIDYGKRRIGLAVGNTDAKIAFALETLTCKNPRALIPKLKQIAAERQVQQVVVGLPLNQTGNEGDMANEVKAWGETLAKALHVPVYFEDERFSSQLADRFLTSIDHNDARDALSAQIILDSYFRRMP